MLSMILMKLLARMSTSTFPTNCCRVNVYNILDTLGNSYRQRVHKQYPGLASPYNVDRPGRNVAIFGSFKPDNWKRIVETRERFRKLGFHILAPLGDLIPGPPDSFALLDVDKAKLT